VKHCSNIRRFRWRKTILLLPFLALPALLATAPVEIGFPLDDAWIFAVFAKNLRESGEWSYNPGEPCAGVTSLLWTWLLSLCSSDSGPPFKSQTIASDVFSILFGLLPLAIALPTIYASGLEGAWKHRYTVASFLALLALSHGMWAFHTFSGMETVLFVSLGMATIGLHSRGCGLPAAVAVALLVLTRLEGFLLAVVLMAHSFWWRGKRRPLLAVVLSAVRAPLFLFSFLALAGVAFHNRRLTGAPFPATFAGRRFLFQLDPDKIHLDLIGVHLRGFLVSWLERVHDWYWMDNLLPIGSQVTLPGGPEIHMLSFVLNLFLGIGALVVFTRLFDRKRWSRSHPLFLFAVWTLVHNLFYIAVLPAGGHAGRYQAINYLWPPVLVLVGAQEALRFSTNFLGRSRPFLARGRIWTVASYLSLALLAVPCFASHSIWKKVIGDGVHRVNSLHVAMGEWAKENLPPQSRVVAFDLGAFKMASGLYVVDQSGLLDDRGLESFRKHNSPEFYRERNATHLFRFERLDAPDPEFSPSWKTELHREHVLSVSEEIGLDREACQNTWSRCSLFRIVYLD
jgi:hypothetical protein